MNDEIKTIEDLYIKHKPKVYSYFYYQTGNSHIAEELCQEVFLKAFKGLPSYRGMASLKTWLYSIAHNLYVTWYRREIKLKFTPFEDDFLNSLASGEPLPEEAALSRDNADSVRKVLSLLSEDYRAVLILSDIDELSYLEISQSLGWSLQKVKITLYRARMKFREYYEKEGEAGEMRNNS